MASTLVLLLQLVLVSLASASHHFGGTTTFSYKGRNSDGTYRVDIRYRGTFDGCSHVHRWNCYGSNCNQSGIAQRGIIDRSYSVPQNNNHWCENEILDKKKIWNNKPFEMRASSCCWISSRNGVSRWTLQTVVDLGTRSDTGKPNVSPDIAILPFLRTPQNCPRTYKLMSFDPDGDKVRCRYGDIKYVECNNCDQPSGFFLNQDSCTLHYHYSIADPKVYGFEMVVEDFPQTNITLSYSDGSQSSRAPLITRSKRALVNPYVVTARTTTTIPPYTGTTKHLTATTPPLSKLPLHFSFLVDPPITSCEEGHCLPKFLYPTPDYGTHIQAEVDKEVVITVKAQSTHATLTDVIISGPLNITKKKTASDEFVIRWKPIADDLGDHYAICFAAEASNGSRVYQSEMRCVVVDILDGQSQVKSHVVCDESTMTVGVEKSSYPGLQVDNLQLIDPANTACSIRSNSTHIYAVVPLNSCGTKIEENDEYLIFKNLITSNNITEYLVTRRQLLEMVFDCQYPKRGNVTLSYSVHRKSVTVLEKGFGRFTYQFEFYPNSQFQTMIDPDSYPLEYNIGSRIYMQMKAISTVNNTELFVESCTAAPYDNPNYQPSYTIIDNGCKVDPTVIIYPPSQKKQFRFSMEAFKFIGLYDQVYISCSVLICQAGIPGTRCSQGCINPNPSHHHHHRKREAATQSSKHFISQGPLRLRRSAESAGSPVINPNLVFIAGCLLAAVGMISAVVIYKAKMSKVKYQPLPAHES